MKLAPHKPIRDKYHPTPNKAERAHHLRLIELPCIGCGMEPCGVVHHVLGHDAIKRWRRDHRIVVPVCHSCHTEIHKGEANWEEVKGVCLGEIAADELYVSKVMGIL